MVQPICELRLAVSSPGPSSLELIETVGGGEVNMCAGSVGGAEVNTCAGSVGGAI